MTKSERPLTILIAALGGEGGGVLTNWIVTRRRCARLSGAVHLDPRRRAAHRRDDLLHRDLPEAQATSSAASGRCFALTPGIGDIDIVVASELMEAGRAVAAGFVTPDRTLTIASSGRFYVMNEKIAMGDGRYDQNRLIAAIEKNSQRRIVIDMEALARQHGAMINAVMLGALAGCGRLPIPT